MFVFLLASVTFAVAHQDESPAHRFDWPQWQGPQRNAKSKETGLLQKWPADGPPQVWRADELGGGYSAPSVADGRVFGLGFVGGDEVVWALDAPVPQGRQLDLEAR
jgi:hypothetical protein